MPSTSTVRTRTTAPPPPVDTLADIPGIGPAVAARIRERFGDAQRFLAAVQAGEVDRIADIPGIGSKRAVQIVRELRGEAAPTLCGTAAAEKLLEDVLETLVERAVTTPAKNRLRLIGPLPDRKSRDRAIAAVVAAAQTLGDIDLVPARRALQDIKPLPAPRPRFEATVALFVDGPDDRAALQEAGIDAWAPIVSAHDPDGARGAETGLYLYSDGGSSLMEAEHVVSVPFTTELAVAVPWSVTARFEAARKTLGAAAELSRLRGRPSAAGEALALLDKSKAERAGVDPQRLEPLADALLVTALKESDEALAQLTLTGRDLVRALSSDPPAAVRQVYAKALATARRSFQTEVGIDLDPFTDTVPPTVDQAALQEARKRLQNARATSRLEAEAKAAATLTKLLSAVQKEIDDHVAFDHDQALGSFVRDHGLSAPTWGEGLTLRGALHLEHPGGEPVDYHLGKQPGDTDDARVAILTGANSGGKTTLLETVAQVLLLAHSGLPVPAREAVVPEVDTVHLFARQRQLGAGAFEAFLTDLFPVTDASGRVFVLADELEAMTELEAAAAIIADLLDALHERGAHALVVTHMAKHIRPLTQALVRVDGIEADGLDAEDRLIVRRSPRIGHHARSTPELILTRLARQGPKGLRERFARLAEKVRAEAMADRE